jgi:ribose transport system permease protein
VGRRISFISPYAAFVVLGTVVVAIMLQVSTYDALVTAPTAKVAQQTDLLTRYLLLPPMPSVDSARGAFSTLQKVALVTAAGLVALTLAARVAVAEAISSRFGTFLYVMIGILVIVVFLLIGEQSHAVGAVGALAR